jgi:hypothetical protein
VIATAHELVRQAVLTSFRCAEIPFHAAGTRRAIFHSHAQLFPGADCWDFSAISG